MKAEDLRKEFTTKYDESVKSEVTSYNPDYVSWLEKKVIDFTSLKVSPYPKMMMVWDEHESKAVPRFVLCEHKGIYNAIINAESELEANSLYEILKWPNAKDIN